MNVLNMRLNWRGSESVPFMPHDGHWASADPGVPLIRGSSARKRFLQLRQSTSGSTKPATWPLASQTRGCMRIAASRPSMWLLGHRASEQSRDDAVAVIASVLYEHFVRVVAGDDHARDEQAGYARLERRGVVRRDPGVGVDWHA